MAQAPDRDARAERDPVATPRPGSAVMREVIGRIGRDRARRRRPRRIVVGHIDGVGLGRLDRDHLLAVVGGRDRETFCCLVVCSLLFACAFARSRCTASMTSGCCASTASPSFCVQSSLVLIMVSTVGRGDERLHAVVPALLSRRSSVRRP